MNLEKLNQDYRYIVIGNYKIIYRIYLNEVIINDVFDTRQDPEKMRDDKRNKDQILTLPMVAKVSLGLQSQ